MNDMYHYGVLGMKWGIRRARKNTASSNSSRKSQVEENVNDDYKRAHSKKSVKQMSDKELREKLNRLQMEQQYSKLSGNDVSKGQDYVNKLIKAGTTVATVTSTALTIYNNANKIKEIIEKVIPD